MRGLLPLLLGSCSLEPATSGRSPTNLLTVKPHPLSLGKLRPHQPASASIHFHNPGRAAVVIGRVETSCDCIRLGPLPLTIGPDGDATLGVTFDPSAEPAFRGGLSVEVAGWNPEGLAVFRTRVLLDVMADTSRPAGPTHAVPAGDPLVNAARAASRTP